MKRVLVAGTILCVVVTPAAAQQRHDGNWWGELTQKNKDLGQLTQLVFVNGLLQGASVLATALASNRQIDEYSALARQMFQGVSPGQLKDGIDAFYADFRNRRIFIGIAAYIVVKQIAGTPQAEIDADIEYARRLAAQL